MNPNQSKGEQPSLSLPETDTPSSELKANSARLELDYQIPKQPGSLSTASLGTATMPVPTSNNVKTAAMPPKDPALTHLPHVAGDIDLMEKEWMMKAKQLLYRNRNNPFQQVNEINLLKAAYLKKRFNKELKAADG